MNNDEEIDRIWREIETQKFRHFKSASSVSGHNGGKSFNSMNYRYNGIWEGLD